MSKGTVAGAIKEATGKIEVIGSKVRSAIGHATGDEEREARGKIDDVHGNVDKVTGNIQKKLRQSKRYYWICGERLAAVYRLSPCFLRRYAHDECCRSF